MTREAALRNLERITALLDGRLTGAERDEVIAQVEADEDLREVFAEALRFRAQSPAGAPAALASPPHGHFRGAWKIALPLAAAATLAVVLLPRGKDRWAESLTIASLTRAAGVTSADRLQQGWYEHAWSVPRSDESSVPAAGGNPSFRLGVRLQDLMLAFEAGRNEDAIRLGQRLEKLLDEVSGSELLAVEVAALLRHLESGAEILTIRTRLEALERALSRHREIDAAAFALGKWAAAGRVAALTGNTRAFSAELRAPLAHAQRLSVDTATRDDLERLRAALAAPDRQAALAAAFERWINHF